MPLDMDFTRLTLPPVNDFHVHLRQDVLMEMVTPLIRRGGVDTVYVMPNTTPPITTVQQALDYKSQLQALAPDVTFLMTLYLHPSITRETIQEAAKAGIVGVKSYPQGVTTNSSEGVINYDTYRPVFQAMAEHGLVLNLHGEVPSSGMMGAATWTESVTVMNAETKFLPILEELHYKYPKLKIVLEHCSTREAVDLVSELGRNVAGTITAHHMWLTVDDTVASPHAYCKPVPKSPEDRIALIQAAASGNSKFFFGSDSAPHLLTAKFGDAEAAAAALKGTTATQFNPGSNACAAGVFTQPYATQLVVGAMEEAVSKGWVDISGNELQKNLESFLCTAGRDFYGLKEPKSEGKVVLEKTGEKIEQTFNKPGSSNVVIVPCRAGKEVHSLRWEK